MNRIIDILIKRDNLTYEEASEQFEYAQNLIHEAIANCDDDEIEEIMRDELGLEMDYIFDIL